MCSVRRPAVRQRFRDLPMDRPRSVRAREKSTAARGSARRTPLYQPATGHKTEGSERRPGQSLQRRSAERPTVRAPRRTLAAERPSPPDQEDLLLKLGFGDDLDRCQCRRTASPQATGGRSGRRVEDQWRRCRGRGVSVQRRPGQGDPASWRHSSKRLPRPHLRRPRHASRDSIGADPTAPPGPPGMGLRGRAAMGQQLVVR